MEYQPDKIVFKCNACGTKFNVPDECEHCRTSLCPECKRSGCIVNILEMHRMVSHSVTLKSQMKKKNNSKPKTPKDPQKRIQELMERTQ